jgi:putative ABC transport system permease protein
MTRPLRSWLWHIPVEREVDEELDFHVEMRTRALIERGMDPDLAHETALRRLGDVRRLKRTCVDLGRKRDREMRLTQWLEEFGSDVRFAVRQLRRAPAFALVAAITLALGIGANSAMFALVDATWLRPLPCVEPDRLVQVWERFGLFSHASVAPLNFRDWNERNQTFGARPHPGMTVVPWAGWRRLTRPVRYVIDITHSYCTNIWPTKTVAQILASRRLDRRRNPSPCRR